MKILTLILSLRTTLVRAYELTRDVRVPMRLKLFALAGAIFILSPLNILGDIPILGIADDAALLALLANWFVRASERHTGNVPGQITVS